MAVIIAIASFLLILLLLVDAFESLVLPRRIKRRLRPARLYYRTSWKIWSTLAWYIPPGGRRETYLSYYGPLSLFGLLCCWAFGLILGFTMLHWSLGTPLHSVDGQSGFSTYLYMSGVTFFTLGYGDVTPASTFGRFITVTEAGIGFGFLAVVIGYLPVVYQSFSRRETEIAMLDARAGSPPTAAQFLLRLARGGDCDSLDHFLVDWERWAAELLESNISFPVLCYYRSQHDNQSWLGALATILDTCAVGMAAFDIPVHQMELTFAMARHVAVDMSLVFSTPPQQPDRDRLPSARLHAFMQELREAEVTMRDASAIEAKLTELRQMYEPFLEGLARFLFFSIPPIVPEGPTIDNWQSSAWTHRVAGIDQLAPRRRYIEDDHLF